MKDFKIRVELRAHGLPANALAFSPDGTLLASASGDWTLILRRMTAGYTWSCRTSPSSSIVSLAFSPDGAKLATSHINGEVKIRDVTTPEVSTLVGRFAEVPRALAFSHDCRTLAASAMSSAQILCWDLATVRTRSSFTGPALGTPTLAFSSDGKLLVAAGSDGILHFRDLIADRQWAASTGHDGRDWSVAFSPDGRTLVSGGNDQAIRLWDVSKLSSVGKRG